MTQELKDKVNKYLPDHNYLNLATVSSQGNPMAHTMAYVSKDLVVYLTTNKLRGKSRILNTIHM